MGDVYYGLALGHHGFSKPVAIKRLRPEFARDSRFVARLVEEANLLVTLQHSNLVSVLDLGRTGDDVFIVLEYVDGPDLSTLLARADRGRLPVGLAVFVCRAACEGMAFAHERPSGAVIHADLSPANVLVSRAGEVKVTDFGIARRQSAQHGNQRIEGKLPYMAPEQLGGHALTPRTDIYALGVMLYQLLTGVLPFDGTTAQVSAGIMRSEPVALERLRPELPPALCRLCARAMARDPGQRIGSMRELSTALREISYTCDLRDGATELARFIADHDAPAGQGQRGMTDILADIGIGSAERRATVNGAAGFIETHDLSATVVRRTATVHSGILEWQQVEATGPAGSGETGRRPGPWWSAWSARWAGLALLVASSAVGVSIASRPDVPASDMPGEPGEIGEPGPGTASRDQAAVAAAASGSDPAARREGDAVPVAAMGAHNASAGASAADAGASAPEAGGEASAADVGAGASASDAEPDKPAARSKKGTLRIYSEPWAYVSVDGKATGRATPIGDLRLPPGKHRIRLHNPVVSFEKELTVTIRSGKTTTVQVKPEGP